eukprot:TRINITY_DN3711_c0_g3_i2.p2 TRINITY_DN3711_c0_g3~~TRINITY_DN3711_c0_g3_i2.p2  ORF type:complete len:303 (-),score=94.47 TRINITY_DN3711_c0_g3_i2:34-942(-)
MAVLCATRCLWPLPLLLLLLLLLPPLMLLRTQPEPAAAAAAATRISVVYFTALRPAKWQGLVTLQLRALVDCGLAAAADSVSVLFSSVTEDAEGERLLREAAALASALLAGSRFTVRTQLGNHYELPGVRRAWELAVIDSGGGGGDPRRHLVLYHHGKGMFSAARLSDPARSPRVRLLTSAVVLPWRDVVRRFENDSAVNKAGFLAAPDGCVWFNFWWARASYLRLLAPPEQHDEDRWYFEHWLGALVNRSGSSGRGGSAVVYHAGANDTLSLCAGNRARTLNYYCASGSQWELHKRCPDWG